MPRDRAKLIDLLFHSTRWEIHDDNGKRVRVFTGGASLPTQGHAPGVMTDEQYKQIQAAVRKHSRSTHIVKYLGYAMLTVGVLMMVRDLWPWIARSAVAFPVRYVFQNLVFIVMGYYFIHWLGSDKVAIRKTLLEANRCASCGYALKGVPASKQGLTTCPECNACWRLPKEEDA